MVGHRGLFTGLVVLIAMERLAELAISRRHEDWLVASGAVEVGAAHYPWMVLQHSLFLVSCLLEVWWLRPPFHPTLAIAMLGALAASMALRYWVMATLGRRWTTRVLCLPGEPVITSGPYRHLRHPNYLAVAVEIFALPMVHTAWVTALGFSLVNAWLLRRRIAAEEEGLRQHNDFDARFAASRERESL